MLLYHIQLLPFTGFSTLIKGKTHSYIKREPTGKPKPKWRYWYRLPQGKIVHDQNVKVGAKFRHGKEDTQGHYEVVSVGADGKVKIKHDETGHTKDVTQKELEQMIHGGDHALGESVQKKTERLLNTYKQALKTGTTKQKANAKKRLQEHVDSYKDIGDEHVTVGNKKIDSAHIDSLSSTGGTARDRVESLPEGERLRYMMQQFVDNTSGMRSMWAHQLNKWARENPGDKEKIEKVLRDKVMPPETDAVSDSGVSEEEKTQRRRTWDGETVSPRMGLGRLGAIKFSDMRVGDVVTDHTSYGQSQGKITKIENQPRGMVKIWVSGKKADGSTFNYTETKRKSSKFGFDPASRKPEEWPQRLVGVPVITSEERAENERKERGRQFDVNQINRYLRQNNPGAMAGRGQTARYKVNADMARLLGKEEGTEVKAKDLSVKQASDLHELIVRRRSVDAILGKSFRVSMFATFVGGVPSDVDLLTKSFNQFV